VYRRTVQTTLKASYSNHYRRGPIELLDVLEFRSNNATHRPVLDALDLIKRHAVTRLTYYPAGETVPTHKGLLGDWTTLVFNDTGKGRGRRVVSAVYEICAFQALRERLRCKEIWVVGTDNWRNPRRGPVIGTKGCGDVDGLEMLVEHLREEEAAESEDAERVPLRVVAGLDAMPVDVARRLGEAHAEESPPLELAGLLPESVLTGVGEDVGEQRPPDEVVAVRVLRVAGPDAHLMLYEMAV
jgi:hypothetical protein